MALAGRKGVTVQGGRIVTAPTNPQDSIDGVVSREVTATPRPERSNLVDSNYIPAQHLLNQVDGTPTIVDYFRQLLGADDAAKPLQLSTSKAIQKYSRIKNFIVRITTGMDPKQDPETKEWEATGSGLLQNGIRPNEGDMILLDAGEGFLGLVAVTRVEKAAYTQKAVYEFDFKLIDRLDPNRSGSKWIDNLESKVVSTYIFDDSLLEMMDNPFLTEEDHLAFKEIGECIETLKEYYIPQFWMRSVGGYLPPLLTSVTYDGFHSRFCRQIGLYDVHRDISLYNNGPLDYNTIYTIWDCITDMSDRKFFTLVRKFGEVPVGLMRKYPVLRGVGYSHYDYTLYPLDDIPVEDDNYQGYAPTTPVLRNEPFVPDLAPSYKAVDCDAFYVFSEAFYEGLTTEMSSFERAVHAMLIGEYVDIKVVNQFYHEYLKLRKYEQFYYGPVLMVLMKYVKRNPQWV